MAQSNRMRLYLDMVFGINSIIQMYEKKWNQSILMKCGDKILIYMSMLLFFNIFTSDLTC